MTLTLTILPETFAIARLDAHEGIPDWLDWCDPFVSVTRTADELSIVCRDEHMPENIRAARGWRVFKVEGPLDFALTGILAQLTAPLAEAGISIFALSTCDTDYLLVRASDLDRAAEVLAKTCRVIRG